MALEEEVVDDAELAELGTMCEVAAAARGDGNGDADDDNAAHQVHWAAAPAPQPNEEPEKEQLELEHGSDFAEAAAAVDADASFELRRAESEDDEAKEDGDDAAFEPASKPAGELEFEDVEEEKPEEMPALLSRVPPAEGVLELPIDVNSEVAEKLIERMERAGLTPTSHSTPFKVAAPSLAGSTGDEIYFVLADEVSRVREVKSAAFVSIKPEQIVTVEGCEGFEWLTQGALFFHCSSAQAATHMRKQYGTRAAVLNQWLIVLFNAHAGSKPTFVPASAIQAVREPTKADEQSGAGFVHAGARAWLGRLSEQATKGEAGAVQLPALVPFATAQAALRAHAQVKKVAATPKKVAARALAIPEGSVCKVKQGRRVMTMVLSPSTKPDGKDYMGRMLNQTTGELCGPERYVDGEGVDGVLAPSVTEFLRRLEAREERKREEAERKEAKRVEAEEQRMAEQRRKEEEAERQRAEKQRKEEQQRRKAEAEERKRAAAEAREREAREAKAREAKSREAEAREAREAEARERQARGAEAHADRKRKAPEDRTPRNRERERSDKGDRKGRGGGDHHQRRSRSRSRSRSSSRWRPQPRVLAAAVASRTH